MKLPLAKGRDLGLLKLFNLISFLELNSAWILHLDHTQRSNLTWRITEQYLKLNLFF
jgi:hypothetical protein